MLTRLIIRNFKRFRDVEIELGSPVIFIGPNNSGKTTALQALALWDIGLRRWREKRAGRPEATKRPGVTINRRDLVAVPVPGANLLWRDLHVREMDRAEAKLQTRNILIEIIVEGIEEGRLWQCGLEFDYANEESFYCRPLRQGDSKDAPRMPIPDEAANVRVAFLPPMSGMAADETRLDAGAINVRIGEGRTAEVLRNLCYRLVNDPNGGPDQWRALCEQIEQLFGVRLGEPQYIQERGEITMTYRDQSGSRLDLSSSGRGLQQTLLLLAYLAANPRSVLLLDEPDAHLEILRQRQIYQLLTDSARRQNSQIIAASHSEVILNEAADRDMVVAFVGKPHRIDDRGSQVGKSLKEIGFDEYYQAQQRGWVLYVEGSTDLDILRAFAGRLNHPARQVLASPFVKYIGNLPQRARDHFNGLREAWPRLMGYSLCDSDARLLSTPMPQLKEYKLRRREIENYLWQPETLLAYAGAMGQEKQNAPLFASRWRDVMQECLDDLVPRAALRDLNDPWWIETKASDVLRRIFEDFFRRLSLPNLLNKTDYHVLAHYVPDACIDDEVTRVLDDICVIAESAVVESEE